MRKDIIEKLFGNSEATYYRWKKEKRPIIELVEKYFLDSEIEEFLNKGKITKLEIIKNYNANDYYGNIAEIIENSIIGYNGSDQWEQDEDVGIALSRFFASYQINQHVKKTSDFYDNIDFNKLFIQYGNGNIELYDRIKHEMQPNVLIAIGELKEKSNFFTLITNKNFGKYVPIYILIEFYIPYILYMFRKSKSTYTKYDCVKVYNNYFTKDHIVGQDYLDIMYDIKIKNYSLEDITKILHKIINDILDHQTKTALNAIDNMFIENKEI